MALTTPDPAYTIFVRLPFPRGDFVDPPPVDWDASKDRALWKVLSNAPKNRDIDWHALAAKYDVSLPFLLQQVAWLYERQVSQVKAQMRKVGASKSSAAPSPVPGQSLDNVAGEMMRRTGSSAGGPRAPSSLSLRRDSPVPRQDSSSQGISNSSNRAMAPPLTRTPSTNTANQSRSNVKVSPRPAKATLDRRLISSTQRAPTPIAPAVPRPLVPAFHDDRAASPGPPETESEESSSESGLPAHSRILRRPPRFSEYKMGLSRDGDDDDDDDAPAFLPFSTGPPKRQITHNQDPSATLRGDPKQISRRNLPKRTQASMEMSQNSDSSSSDATRSLNVTTGDSVGHRQRPVGPFSPRRMTELSGRSSGKGKSRDGSDGTPSMGSSFSDLDDASITQSALDEALASNIQGGGMTSRMGTIGQAAQALRSRYMN